MRFSVAVSALVSVVSVSAVDHVIKVGAGGVDYTFLINRNAPDHITSSPLTLLKLPLQLETLFPSNCKLSTPSVVVLCS